MHQLLGKPLNLQLVVTIVNTKKLLALLHVMPRPTDSRLLGDSPRYLGRQLDLAVGNNHPVRLQQQHFVVGHHWRNKQLLRNFLGRRTNRWLRPVKLLQGQIANHQDDHRQDVAKDVLPLAGLIVHCVSRLLRCLSKNPSRAVGSSGKILEHIPQQTVNFPNRLALKRSKRQGSNVESKLVQ